MEKYKLPSAYKNVQYAIEYLDMLEKMSNDDLLDEIFDAQRPDDWDGLFTKRGNAYREISQGYFRHVFKIYTDLSKDNELQKKIDVLTSCREHWKNSYWDRKAACEKAEKRLEVAREAMKADREIFEALEKNRVEGAIVLSRVRLKRLDNALAELDRSEDGGE